MKDSQLVLAPTFNKFREQPKWLVNMIVLIVISIISTMITMHITDITAEMKNEGLSDSEIQNMKAFMTIFTYIYGAIGPIFTVAISFVFILVISKIMKSEVKASSLFAAATLYTLISSLIALIIVAILALFGLDPTEYSITSLQIFNQDNAFLGAFDIITLIDAYLFGIILYATSRLSGKASLIWSIAYIIVVIGFSLIGASIK